VSSSTHTEDLNVDSSIREYFFLIVRTEIDDFSSIDLSVRNVDVFFGNIDVIKKMVVHVVVVRLFIVFLNRIVLIEVECHHILETKLTLFVKSYQFTI